MRSLTLWLFWPQARFLNRPEYSLLYFSKNDNNVLLHGTCVSDTLRKALSKDLCVWSLNSTESVVTKEQRQGMPRSSAVHSLHPAE